MPDHFSANPPRWHSSLQRLALSLAAAVVCLLPSFGNTANSEPLPIAVGIDPTFVAFFVAKQEKLFEKHGLDVQLVTFGPGGAMIDGMMAGQAVMTASTETSHIVRMAHADIRALGLVGESGDNLKLVANAATDKPEKIRKLGVVPGGVFEYLSSVTLKTYGLDPASVEMVKSGPPELPALLARGDIDAFWLFEPFPTMVVQQQGGRVLARSKDVGYTYGFWVSAMGDWLKDNGPTAHKVMSALADACAITTTNPELAAEAVQAQVKIPTAQTIDFLKEVRCNVRDFTDGDLASYDAIADFLSEAKITATRVDVRSKVETGFYTK